jgi:2-dehydropantoate 2-reductase
MTRIGIMGAGAIGCYVGGRLLAGGHDVVLVGRDSLAREVREHGLRVTDYLGFDERIPPARARIDTSPEALRRCDAVIVTVKNLDTEATAQALRPVLEKGAVVASFQNGVRAAKLLKAALPGHAVLAAMVPFNVVRKDAATFHRGTSGRLVVEASEAPAAQALTQALAGSGLETDVHGDVIAVQWGKLLFNLNNAVNALAGVPLREQIGQRAYRRIMAAVMGEAVDALARAHIAAVLEKPLPPRLLPHILRLPNFAFRSLAGAMLQIDPEARSSMWDDLERRRATEIDYLNGEVVALAREHGGAAPVNAALVGLIRKAEAARAGSPCLTAAALAAQLGLPGV